MMEFPSRILVGSLFIKGFKGIPELNMEAPCLQVPFHHVHEEREVDGATDLLTFNDLFKLCLSGILPQGSHHCS